MDDRTRKIYKNMTNCQKLTKQIRPQKVRKD